MNRILEQVIHQNGTMVDRILSEHTLGYVVSDNMANAVAETSFDNTSAQAIVKHLNGLLVGTCQSVIRDLDPSNKLCFMRLATRKFEYLVAPEEYFTITVVQWGKREPPAYNNLPMIISFKLEYLEWMYRVLVG